uniref:ZnMc domain-containing protein n=1 Tax=Steinernema glaseri TaxID=37863 RepID=A0A1I7YZX5_9BILA
MRHFGIVLFLFLCTAFVSAVSRQEEILRALDQLNRDLDRRNAHLAGEDKVATYLASFGYLNVTSTHLAKEDIQYALLKFQSFMGIPKTGSVDDAVRKKMLESRCGLADELPPQDRRPIWHKPILTWNISSFSDQLSEGETREAIHRAFSAWEKALPMNFLEISQGRNADIVIGFAERKPKESRDITGTSAAETNGARILLWNDQEWSYLDRQSAPEATDLYHVLLHEIGHVLGMEHSQDKSSIMYPTFASKKKDIGHVDVENVRKLYGVLHGTAQGVPGSTEKERKCPKKLDAVTQAANQQTFVFLNNNYWRFKNQKVIQGPLPISQAFPNGPSFVNVSVTTKGLTVLIEERTIYGYTWDEHSGVFRADNFPKMLHDRVLFFPEAAFPLSNGSVVLLSDDVFATYDLWKNVPTNLNDKRVFYPNLPDELRSGIPQKEESDSAYWMFTEDTVYSYDNVIQKVTSKTPLSLYFSCE